MDTLEDHKEKWKLIFGDGYNLCRSARRYAIVKYREEEVEDKVLGVINYLFDKCDLDTVRWHSMKNMEYLFKMVFPDDYPKRENYDSRLAVRKY